MDDYPNHQAELLLLLSPNAAFSFCTFLTLLVLILLLIWIQQHAVEVIKAFQLFCTSLIKWMQMENSQSDE